MWDKNGRNCKRVNEKPRTKKGRRKSVWRKNVLDSLEAANAHLWLKAATKTKLNRFQRSFRNLAEPFQGTEAGKAKSSPEMSRNEHWDKLRQADVKLSFKPSNELLRANTEPRARPESSQVNQRAEPRFEPRWDSSKAEPVSKPKPRL